VLINAFKNAYQPQLRLNNQFVPHSKDSTWVTKSQL